MTLPPGRSPWPAKNAAPTLSLLIVTYNSWRICTDAVASFAAHPPAAADGTPLAFEVIVVDNASPARDPAAEAELRAWLERLGGRLVRHGENSGYARGMNLAYSHARGDWILVINPDVLFLPGTVNRLLRLMERHRDVGAAAPASYLDRGLHCRLPPNIVPTLGDLVRTTAVGISRRAMRRYSQRRTRAALAVWEATAPVELPMLSGCCFLMRRADIERIGFFDPRYPLYYEDTDLSVRILRAGMRIVQAAGAQLVHLYDRSGQTNHAEAMARYWVSRRAYYRKWYGLTGALVFDASRRLLATRWAQARAARELHPDMRVLPPSRGAPTLPIPEGTRRWLIELSPDSRFYLAAGILGEGSSWTAPPALLDSLGPTTYYFRVCDRDRDGRQVAVLSFQRLASNEREQPPPAAPRAAEDKPCRELS